MSEPGGPKGPTGPVWPPTGPTGSTGAMGPTWPTYYGGSGSTAVAITTFGGSIFESVPTPSDSVSRGPTGAGATGTPRVRVRIDASALICPHCGSPLDTDLTGSVTRPGTVSVEGIGACSEPTCPGKRRPGGAPLMVRGEEGAEEITRSGVYEFIYDDSDEPSDDDPALTDPDLWR
jgi:hypothetical protein